MKKDLRIGNSVEAHGDWGWEVVEVTDLSDAEIGHTTTGSLGSCNDECRPIPLTEELLLRFGFEDHKNTGNWKIKGNKYWSLGEQKQGYLKIKLTKAHNFRVENFGNKSIMIKHVHTLQNLYFALTGKELNQ
jgi:hypothetical protein